MNKQKKMVTSLKNQKIEAGINSIISTILIIIIFLMINYLSIRHFKRLDWTQSGFYSLSPKMSGVLSEIENKELKIIVFLEEQNQIKEDIKELLKEMTNVASSIKIEHINIDQDLSRAKLLIEKYGIQDTNVVLFSYESRMKIVTQTDMAEFDFSGGAMYPRVKAFLGEQAFASAILSVLKENQLRICFTSGHSERDPEDYDVEGYSDIKSSIEGENIKVEIIETVKLENIPDYCNSVIIAGPNKPFLKNEINLLDDYLTKQGKLFILIDPLFEEELKGFKETGLEQMLLKWGIQIDHSIVVDPSQTLPFIGADTLFISNYSIHTIVENMKDIPTILPLTRSVRELKDAKPKNNLVVMDLLRTTDEGWGETNLEALRNEEVELDNNDIKGPVSVAVSGEQDLGKEQKAAGTRIVVIGDSDVVKNSQLRNIGNKDFFMNTINWLVQREKLISITPKTPENVKLTMTENEMNFIFWLVTIIMPGLALIAGVRIWIRRRA